MGIRIFLTSQITSKYSRKDYTFVKTFSRLLLIVLVVLYNFLLLKDQNIKIFNMIHINLKWSYANIEFIVPLTKLILILNKLILCAS